MTAVASDPVERLLGRLEKVKELPNGSFSARCPAHADGRPSLNVRRGDDGRVLVKCYAGCETAAVVSAVGVTLVDLFPPKEPAAIKQNGHGRRVVATYDYRAEDGRILYQAVRFEPKGFAQRRPDGRGGWGYRLGDVRHVPYRLPELMGADPAAPVCLCEGEQDADRLAALGFVATTNAAGAGQWRPEYGEALRGRVVAIFEDNDDAGRKRTAEVGMALAGVAAEVRVLALPGLPERGDASDWLDAGGDPTELRRLIEAAPGWTANAESHRNLENFENFENFESSKGQTAAPFPIRALPLPVRRFVESAAASIGCPPEFVAVPALALAEGAAGKSRRVIVRDGFEVSPGSWFGVVADPGTGKSPAQKMALRLVTPLQDEAWSRYRDRLDEWQATPKDARGDRPEPEHFYLTDSTGEALWAALSSSVGATQIEDELRRRIKSLDAYRQGGDRQTMLGLWANAPVKIVRRTSNPVYIPFPVSPLVGGIQPGVLAKLRGEGDDAGADDGWVPRFLLCWPNAEPLALSGEPFDHATLGPAVSVFRTLRLHREEPHDTRLSPAAFDAFKEWHADNRRVQLASSGLERQWAAKAPVHLARMALTLHLLATPPADAGLSAETMGDAIEVTEYFRSHLDRVLPAFGASASALGAGLSGRVLRALSRVTEGDGWASRSLLLRTLGNVPAAELSAGLADLLAVGKVQTRTLPTAPRPTEEWRSAESSNTDDGSNFRTFELSDRGAGVNGRTGDGTFENVESSNRDADAPDPVIFRWARKIAAFTDEELAQYRAEMAAAPADDPPRTDELAALRLALAMRAEVA